MSNPVRVVRPDRVMRSYLAVTRPAGRQAVRVKRDTVPLAIVTCPWCGELHAHTTGPGIKRAWCGRGRYLLDVTP